MTTRKPLIALTPNYNIEKEEPYMRPAYIRAIQQLALAGIYRK